MSDGVFVLDAFGRVTDANPAATGLLGTPRPQLVGRALADVLGAAAADGERPGDPRHRDPARVGADPPGRRDRAANGPSRYGASRCGTPAAATPGSW